MRIGLLLVKTLLFLTLLTCSAFAYPPLPEARNEAEALFVRRIIDFWRDKEYPFAKSQIRAYMNTYPDGPFANHFYAMLGDMAMHEKAYREALDYYNRIADEAVSTHVRTKRWQALYQLQLYTELYQEIAPLPLQEMDAESKFYFAEASFREALTLLRFKEGKEQAKSLCEESLPLYASLAFSEAFGAHAKLAMAEIYRFLEKPETAADLYLEIAESQDNQEEVLFHAAAMLVQCDQERAASLFERIARGDSHAAGEAAYQWLQILASKGEWKKIDHERDLWLSKLGEKHRGAAYFYLGMLAFEKNRHYQTIADLQNALEKGISSPHDRTALEALLASAGEVQNMALCDSSYALLAERYPEQRAEAAFVRAMAYQKTGDIAKALVLFEELTQQFPQGPISEKAKAQKIKLLMSEKRWEEAHENVRQFLERHPKSERKGEMLRLAIDLSRIGASENELYGMLAEDLERAFAARIFQGEERSEKEALLTKAYIKLGRIHAALGLLHEMKNPDPLLFAHCYIKEGTSHEKVVFFGEKALKENPENDRLHLHLFNAYLKLAQNSPDESLAKKAAEHLDTIIDIYPVSLENRLWLAHYYVKTQNERAIPLLESLLQTEANWKRFEEEGVMLARLYQKKALLEKARPLVERLISLNQKSKTEAELILAEVLQGLGEDEKAEEIFARLEDSPYLPIAYEASLNLARMRFVREPERSLRKLNNLVMRKKLAYEPIHLEAALDHAELQASLCPEEERLKRFLSALLQVKEEFTSEKDISSKDYHESRPLMPEKEQVYQAYMRYLDARIYNAQAKMASDPQEKKIKENAARALFSTLRQGKYAVSNYLVERAAAGMYEQ